MTTSTGRAGRSRVASALRGGLSPALRSGGIVFLLAQAVANGGNFAFHLAATRLLGADAYGLLGSFLVVLTVLAVPAGACATLLTASIARMHERRQDTDVTRGMRQALALSVVPAALNLAAAPFWMDYLNLGSVMPVVWVSAYILVLGTGVVPLAALCGQGRFAAAGAFGLASVAVRITLLFAFAGLGWGVSGALGATVAGEAARVLGSWWLLRGGRGGRIPAFEASRALSGAGALVGVWLLVGADTVIARHLLSGPAAGGYAATATLARIVFFVAQTGAVLAVPRFATARGTSARTTLAVIMAGLAVLGLLEGVALCAARPWIEEAFGGSYTLDPLLMSLLAGVSTGAGCLWLLMEYQLARGGVRAVFAPWCGLAVLVGVSLVWSLDQIGLALCLLAALLVALLVAALSRPAVQRKDPRPALAVPGPAPEPVPLPTGMTDVTVVVPFYNPGDMLRPNLLSLLDALRTSGVSFEVITVEDGCTDGSSDTIADLDPLVVRRLALPYNSGKGAALRLGLREGRGRYVGFIDADGDLDPTLWQPFLGLVRLYQPDVIIGSKRHPLSVVDESVTSTRRACSRGYQLLVRVLFPSLPVTDTQVGIKLFRREVLAEILPVTVERRFVFDLELLVVARRRGFHRILPAPVTLRRAGGSTVTARAVWRMFADTVALAWRVYGSAAYDAPVPEVVAPRLPEPALPGGKAE